MAWRDELHHVTLPDGCSLAAGSFRGVPFATVGAQAHVGRRAVVHEYPARDVPYVEDLGRRAREYQVEAYVIGADYLAQRDRLIDALEAYGPGELVHPRWGRVVVAVHESVSVSESPERNGMACFSIRFVEAGANIFPGQVADSPVQTADAAQDCDDAACSAFADDIGSRPLPAGAVQAVSGQLGATLGRLTGMAGGMLAGQDLAQVTAGAAGLLAGAPALLRAPLAFARQFQGLAGAVTLGASNPRLLLRGWQAVIAAHPAPAAAVAVAGLPVSVVQARTVQALGAYRALVRRTAIGQYAGALALSTFAGGGAAPAAARRLLAAARGM